jgi:hypothetical protein
VECPVTQRWCLFSAAYEGPRGVRQTSRRDSVFDAFCPHLAIAFLVERDQKGLGMVLWRGTDVIGSDE